MGRKRSGGCTAVGSIFGGRWRDRACRAGVCGLEPPLTYTPSTSGSSIDLLAWAPAPTSPSQKAAVPIVALKKAPAKKAATKKTVAKKAVAKKAPAKKATAKKVPAKKVAAKKAATAKAPQKVESAKGAKAAGSSRRSRRGAPKPAPPIPAWLKDKKWLKQQHQLLLDERRKYTSNAEALAAEAAALMADREPGDVQFDEESGEGDTLAVERDRDLALSAKAREIVDEIDAALIRLDSGVYGVCVSSREIIPKDRLEAMPMAAKTVAAQTAMF